MTAENQLYIALKRLAEEKGKALDTSPAADLAIPLTDGEWLTVSMELLAMGPK